MRCFGDVFEKTSTSMFLTMFFKTQNIVPTMHLTMLIAHPYNHHHHHHHLHPGTTNPTENVQRGSGDQFQSICNSNSLFFNSTHLSICICWSTYFIHVTGSCGEVVLSSPGSLPAVLVLVISLMLLTLGSALVTFHYCRF